MGDPKLLLMDEPLEGLAPVIVEALLAGDAAPCREEAELAIPACRASTRGGARSTFAQSALILDRGRVVYDGPSGRAARRSREAGGSRRASSIGGSGLKRRRYENRRPRRQGKVLQGNVLVFSR